MDTCRDKTGRYSSPFTLAWAVAEVIWSNTCSVSQITAVVHLLCNVLSKSKGEFIKGKKILTCLYLLFPPSDRLCKSHHSCYIASVCVCAYIYEHYIKYILYIHTEDPSSHQYYTFWRTQQFRIKNRSRMKGGKKKKLPKIPRKASHSLQVPGDPIFLWSKE